MKVIIGKSVYETNRKGLRGILKVAKEQVPFGIYAVEKDGICELRKDKFDHKEDLKKEVAEFESKGFRVFSRNPIS